VKRAGLVFRRGRVGCVDRIRVVPVGICQASLLENLLRLDTMIIEEVAKEGSGASFLGTLARVLVVRLGPMGTLTQVLDVGLGGRGTQWCAVAGMSVWVSFAVCAVRALTVRVTPELACTCLLHESKREFLVVVKVVQDVVIHISKGSVGRGLVSGHEDRLQDIINGEDVEVA
jgi:hypothetical protein